MSVFFNCNCAFILLIRYINSYFCCISINRSILLWLRLFYSYRFTYKYKWYNLLSCIADYRKVSFYVVLFLYSLSINNIAYIYISTIKTLCNHINSLIIRIYFSCCLHRSSKSKVPFCTFATVNIHCSLFVLKCQFRNLNN